MKNEIGSNFWEITENSYRNEKMWWESDIYTKVYLKSGRNVFKAICNYIDVDEKIVLFPAYHCETESQPWYESGWSVKYYPVEKNFTVDALKLKNCIEVENPSVVVIQSYYGFEALDCECEKVLNECKDKGITIIEDITQSLISDIRHEIADYHVASFRKFFAIPDGGVLISKENIDIGPIEESDSNICNTARDAYELKKQYFENLNPQIKERFRSAYVDLNELISVNDKLYQMSELSRNILKGVDIKEITSKRVRNFKRLYDGLCTNNKLIITRNIEDDKTCPLFFPVLLKEDEKRSDFQRYLAQNNIYCPIIWGKSKKLINICPKETEEIYDSILCFPIDQRYEDEDMDRVIKVVNRWDV